MGKKKQKFPANPLFKKAKVGDRVSYCTAGEDDSWKIETGTVVNKSSYRLGVRPVDKNRGPVVLFDRTGATIDRELRLRLVTDPRRNRPIEAAIDAAVFEAEDREAAENQEGLNDVQKWEVYSVWLFDKYERKLDGSKGLREMLKELGVTIPMLESMIGANTKPLVPLVRNIDEDDEDDDLEGTQLGA